MGGVAPPPTCYTVDKPYCFLPVLASQKRLGYLGGGVGGVAPPPTGHTVDQIYCFYRIIYDYFSPA